MTTGPLAGLAGPGHRGDPIALDDHRLAVQQLPGHDVKQQARTNDHPLRTSHAAV
jgi:hypothetical protein